MEIVFSGDIYDEKISIKHDDIIIYNGYVDSLVTSEDVESDVELKLNYSNQSNQSNVIARRLGNDILWIPNIKYCFKEKYKYIPLIFSVNEFKKLWDSMRYNFENDIEKIKKVTAEEVMKIHYYQNKNIGTISSFDAKLKVPKPKNLRGDSKDLFWIIDLDADFVPIKTR